MSRATANVLLGIVIGGCALIIFDRFRRVQREEDPDAIAERITQRLQALESRVPGAKSAQAAIHA